MSKMWFKVIEANHPNVLESKMNEFLRKANIVVVSFSISSTENAHSETHIAAIYYYEMETEKMNPKRELKEGYFYV